MADTKSEQGRGLQQPQLSANAGAGGDSRPTHLDLFSGIGGFAIAAQWAGFRTVAFCEIDGYCQKVLAKNFVVSDARRSDAQGRNGHAQGTKGTTRAESASPDCPRIHANIFDFDGTAYRGVDLITGGFPCQPFSVAGKRGGAADDRAIWPEMFRVISEARPTFILGENVPGIIPMELDNVLSDLEGIGYATRSFVIPACAVDARHRRDRVWIVGRLMGDTWGDGGRRRDRLDSSEERRSSISESGQGVGKSISEGLEGRDRSSDLELQGTTQQIRSAGTASAAMADTENSNGWRTDGMEYERWRDSQTGRCSEQSRGVQHWLPEPSICLLADGLPAGLVRYAGRVAKGVPNRVAKLKALGNSIVPAVAYEILREIRKLI